jgi:hypothetical protein
MYVHLHTMRSCCSGALGLILAAFLLHWAYTPPPEEFELFPVTGRVTYGGRPLGGTWVVFEEEGRRGFTACSELRPDGSFRMDSWGQFNRDGIPTGTYKVFFAGSTLDAPETPIDPKYQDPRTSGLLVHVRPDWNDFVFSLPDPGRGPTLAQHR